MRVISWLMINKAAVLGRLKLGIHSGGISLTRYRIIGGTNKPSLAQLNKNLKQWTASPLRLDGIYKELTYGWTRPQNPSLEDAPLNAHWDMSDCQVPEGFLLRFRIEKRQVPKSLLQLVLKEKIEIEYDVKGKYPGHKRKKVLSEELQQELMSKCLPKVSYHDALWQDDKQRVLVFGNSRQVLETFEVLFRESFAKPLKKNLIRISPPLAGLSEEEWLGKKIPNSAKIGQMSEQRIQKLAQTIPISFTGENTEHHIN